MKVIQHISGTDYTLIDRGTSIQPYVLAFHFNPYDNTWAAGHYFQHKEGVKAYLNKCVDNEILDPEIIGYQIEDGLIEPIFK